MAVARRRIRPRPVDEARPRRSGARWSPSQPAMATRRGFGARTAHGQASFRAPLHRLVEASGPSDADVSRPAGPDMGMAARKEDTRELAASRRARLYGATGMAPCHRRRRAPPGRIATIAGGSGPRPYFLLGTARTERPRVLDSIVAGPSHDIRKRPRNHWIGSGGVSHALGVMASPVDRVRVPAPQVPAPGDEQAERDRAGQRGDPRDVDLPAGHRHHGARDEPVADRDGRTVQTLEQGPWPRRWIRPP